ncbi:hypothetical protein BCR35DRAFT_286654 [Leucosporidium creatinivorum]|uniref:Queuosine 5'-phosphate N-glycosylase/hydrolase n=1 Tax=Leucosporidium creatinivorum TaxID=106004 RepID=A0A1Y2G2S7_9BASI|nr:hypothetical protein BCR35DRAFT_286654 [Leucosporidium creatinivorum]
MSTSTASTSNPVLSSAYFVAEQSEHVHLNREGIARAALKLYNNLLKKPYTTSDWSLVPLHPNPSLLPAAELLNLIFTVSSLNFSFWSDLPSDKRYGVKWKTGVDGKETLSAAGVAEEKVHTGYWSLISALHRAREEGVDVTNPRWYATADEKALKRVFRSDQEEEIPLLEERIKVLREVGGVLCEKFDGSFANLVERADHSALTLVDLVVSNFPCYDDLTLYPPPSSASSSTNPPRTVYIRKRAQILVAETWAAFNGEGWGRFDDIDQLTMFADYRVPQILHSLSTISYSPHLTSLLLSSANLSNGSQEEIEIRCLSIAAIEEIRREIVRLDEERRRREEESLGSIKTVELPNAVLLDFLLWDLAKVEEERAELPHHRTRSVFY